MVWQDMLIAIGSVGFSLALIPAARSSSKPPRSSCLLTGGILWSYVLAFGTLGLWYSAATTVITACMWTLLFLQRRTMS